MAIIIKPPGKIPAVGFSIFTAGSIEMGKAVDWQTRISEALKNFDVTILNPRRDDWDSSWTPSITNPQFREQVEWELSAQQRADLIVMYFDPATKSPISLLELGLFGPTGKMIVYCPEGFWRKGNVDIVCAFYDIKQVGSFEELISTVIARIPKRPVEDQALFKVFRAAVAAAKKKDDYFTGGFDIMKKLFRKQHKKQDIRHSTDHADTDTAD
jgi:hypothetical protein